jgi:glycosyltransferase involved in cell wall biosynthesis
MPSLWYEGFGLIVMEAMLRGIPVVASDSGGLPEAKQGTGYLIPVAGIERYLPVFDEHGMPEPVAPHNDAAPWAAAVRELLSDPTAYARESQASRAAAHRFVSTLDGGAMERFLLSLTARDRTATPRESATIESLSPGRRALLLERLRRREMDH